MSLTDSGGGELEVLIRECTASELSVLRAANDSPEFVEHIQPSNDEKSGSTSHLTAWMGPIPIGHLILKWDDHDRPGVRMRLPGTPGLHGITVWPPEMQSRGIGRKLIETAEAMIKADGHERVGLGVEATNGRAQRLYALLGYQDWGHGITHDRWVETDEHGDAVVHDDPCHYLIKNLDQPRVRHRQPRFSWACS